MLKLFLETHGDVRNGQELGVMGRRNGPLNG